MRSRLHRHGVGVADEIEPYAAPTLSVGFVRKRVLHVFIVVGIAVVRGEPIHQLGGGRQSGEAEVEAPKQGSRRGFRCRSESTLFELGQNEGVDRVTHPPGAFDLRHSRPLKRGPGPVLLRCRRAGSIPPILSVPSGEAVGGRAEEDDECEECQHQLPASLCVVPKLCSAMWPILAGRLLGDRILTHRRIRALEVRVLVLTD